MILKYILTDNKLQKEDPTSYPQHLQENITLEFDKTDDSLPNTKYYADIKTPTAIKRTRLKKYNGKYSCELPKWVTQYTFFKLKVHTISEKKHFTTNELIIPINCQDYLDYNRTIAHTFPKPQKNNYYGKNFKKEQKSHDYLHELEELLIQNLEEKGVQTKRGETLKDLINKIKEIE